MRFDRWKLRPENRVYLLLGLLFFVELAGVFSHAVNIPFWDEWDHVPFWTRDLTWSWLTKPHNEHRILPTKFLNWAVGSRTGYDLVAQQIVNFFIFGGLIWAVVAFLRGLTPKLSSNSIVAFSFFLFSPLLYENHLWGFQSQFHFFLLFFVLSLHYLFLKSRPIAGALFGLLSMFSLSGGVVLIAIVAISYNVFQLRNRRLKPALAVTGILLVGAILWRSGHETAAGHLPSTSPFAPEFWIFFFRIVSVGFGYESLSIVLGMLAVALVLAPIVWGLSKRAPLTTSQWASATGTLALLTVLAAISYGRAANLVTAKSSRYVEVGVLLIPFSLATWTLWVPERARYGQLAIWIFAAVGFSNDFDFRHFSVTKHAREEVRSCVAEYYRAGGAADCPTGYPHPLKEKLDLARERNLSFTRGLP